MIFEFVYKLNIIKHLSYDLLNYELTYRLENNLELPIINQNLFYKACCAVSFRNDDWKKKDKVFLTISFLLIIYLPERRWVKI